MTVGASIFNVCLPSMVQVLLMTLADEVLIGVTAMPVVIFSGNVKLAAKTRLSLSTVLSTMEFCEPSSFSTLKRPVASVGTLS